MAEDNEIGKYLRASTGNISYETQLLFEEYPNLDSTEAPTVPVTYEKGMYGWFVHVPDDNDGIKPQELCAILNFARIKGCSWIEFDCDNDPLEGFPVFDW
jgi:hypothetical protein